MQTPGESYRLSRSDLLLLILTGAGLLGATLLGNPAVSSRQWTDRVLERIVWVLSLGYSIPTTRGLEVKSLVIAAVGGMLLVGATVRVVRSGAGLVRDWQGSCGGTTQRVGAAILSVWAALLLIMWGLLSTLWAGDAAIALGSVWVFSLGWVWAGGLALNGHAMIVRRLGDVLLGAAAVTAILSLWYWHSRSQDVRLGWPMGNPLLLASVMVPAVVIGAGRLAERIAVLWQTGLAPGAAAGGYTERGDCSRGLPREMLGILACAAGIGLALVALLATGSRGPLLALAAGLATAGWLSLERRARVAWGLVGIVVLALAAPTVATKVFTAGGGRDASARMRLYAWQDALELGWQKPAAGQGAGGFARLGTSLAAGHTVTDPLAMGGEVSTHAHSEMLEVFADLGVFGLLLGLAAWGLAGVAAAGKARGEQRWIAAAVAGAIVAVFLDACTGVSWRLPGPVAYMAMPVAMAWMLWRQPGEANSPTERIGFRWAGLIPAGLGLAVMIGGVVDFAAARCFQRAQEAVQQAGHIRRQMGQATEPQSEPMRRQVASLLDRAVQEADRARRWRLDPPRRLEAWLGSGRMRAIVPYLAIEGPGEAGSADRQAMLEEGAAILTAMNRSAPEYGDLRWQIAEILNGRADLLRRAGEPEKAHAYRGQSLNEALQYLDTCPLDGDRIWQAMRIWPEIGARQRLRLLRGTLRDESRVWRQPAATDTDAYEQWSEQRWYLTRLWQLPGAEVQDTAASLLETGYSHLQVPYEQWSDPLAPEGVRLAAQHYVLMGRPAEAVDALLVANLLYQRRGEWLGYSQAANYLDIAACRIRQGEGHAAWATADLISARKILATLPKNWVRARIEGAADGLRRAIDAMAGAYAPDDPAVWQAVVDLFWDMPAAAWPKAIEGWARQADELLVRQGRPPVVTLQLALAREDATAAQAQVEALLSQGVSEKDVAAAVRQARFRWPGRRPVWQAVGEQQP